MAQLKTDSTVNGIAIVVTNDSRLSDARTPLEHTQAVSTITDFDTEVSNNTDVAANTAARHSHTNKTILDNTTASFTTADETKLDGIAAGATNYQHPVNHPPSIITQDANNRFMTDAERNKLAGIATGANNYSHPANHAPSIITQDASNRFVTDTEKSTWNGKASFKSGASTFPAGTTHTVTDAFITASTLVTISPTAEKQGVWSVNSADGSFTITSDTAETVAVTFDWGAVK